MKTLSLIQPFKECYQYREVLANILGQDLKVKYKRTYFGYLWSLLNPLLQLLVLSFVFSHVVRQGIKDYTLYLFSGLLAWNYFSNSVLLSSTALLENENFIKKIYLPKIIFPLSKISIRTIDFLFSFLALCIIGFVLGFSFKPTVLLLPLAILSLFAFTLGASIIFSVLTVYFRDTQYLLSVFMQLMYFATPIIYPPNLLPEKYVFIMSLNPVYLQIQLFQKLIYDGSLPSVQQWAISLLVAFTTLIAGLLFLNSKDEDLVFRM